jgi:hypothetical protein
MSERNLPTVDKQGAALGVLARLWWMLLGNAILAFCVLFIFENKGGFFHTADGVFWSTVATLVVVRYLDIRLFQGQTVTGVPATLRHWVMYVALLLVCSVLVWVSAHAANHLLIPRETAG